MQSDIDAIKGGDIVITGMKRHDEDADEEVKEDAKSEGHISITAEDQFLLIRQDISELREELLQMINSNKNKTYDCEKKIKFIDDWKAFN
jgi:selenocysteine-specific translation elongation factor